MAATNIMFSILAWTGKSEWLFAVAVLLDDIGGICYGRLCNLYFPAG